MPVTRVQAGTHTARRLARRHMPLSKQPTPPARNKRVGHSHHHHQQSGALVETRPPTWMWHVQSLLKGPATK